MIMDSTILPVDTFKLNIFALMTLGNKKIDSVSLSDRQKLEEFTE